MKKKLRIPVKPLLPFIYGIVFSIYFSGFVFSAAHVPQFNQNTGTSYAAFVPVNHFNQAINSESQITVISNFPVTSFKNFFKEASTCNRLTELKLYSPILQYIVGVSRDILKFHSTDIIFPFHLFW